MNNRGWTYSTCRFNRQLRVVWGRSLRAVTDPKRTPTTVYEARDYSNRPRDILLMSWGPQSPVLKVNPRPRTSCFLLQALGPSDVTYPRHTSRLNRQRL